MAEAPKEARCPGCARKTNLGQKHCQYPSNPAYDALHKVKADPKSDLPTVANRRARANSISRANQLRSV